MFIQTEQTPNPETVKFLPGRDVFVSSSGVQFLSAEEAKSSPLALALFGVAGVSGVFLGRDFIAVTKTSELMWPQLKPLVLSRIVQHFSSGGLVMDPDFSHETDKEKTQEESLLDSLSLQIKTLIDERVRPAVAMDGGDIVFERFENGIVYLHMRGACSGCPSATVTLKSGVERMLRHYVPEVLEVRQVRG